MVELTPVALTVTVTDAVGRCPSPVPSSLISDRLLGTMVYVVVVVGFTTTEPVLPRTSPTLSIKMYDAPVISQDSVTGCPELTDFTDAPKLLTTGAKPAG